MSRTYSQVPEPRFVEAAKTVIPSGEANGTPVDMAKLVAQQVPTLVTNKYLHTKTSSGATVMEWADAPTELPEYPTADDKTYVLTLTFVEGQPVLSWAEET